MNQRSGITALLRPGLALVLAAPLVLTATPAGAAGVDPLTVDNLPSVSDTELAGHIVAIDVPEIVAINVPEIDTFAPEVSTDGADTVVSLDTDVLFRFGEATLTEPATEAVIDAVADVPDGATVDIVGHTDSIGSDADNQTLSEERARAVAEAIAAERADLELDVSGKGETEPVEPNERGDADNPEGREKNRRVELRYAD